MKLNVVIVVIWSKYCISWSKLERICSRRSNELSLENMEDLLFMVALNLLGKDVLYYKDEFI